MFPVELLGDEVRGTECDCREPSELVPRPAQMPKYRRRLIISEMRTGLIEIKSDLDELRSVMVCKPTYLRVTEILNEVLAFWTRMGYPPLAGEALKQHDELVRALEDCGVEVYFLEPIPECPYQVFTRDIGVSLDGRRIVVARMRHDARALEIQALTKRARDLNKELLYLPDGAVFEGGNYLAYSSELVFLGVSARTNWRAVEALRELLQPRVRVIPIELPSNVIHLDVVMNFPSRDLAVVHEPSLPSEVVSMLREDLNLNLLRVNFLQRLTLAVNFLPIKDRVVIAAAENPNVNRELRREGIDVIEIPYKEMLKCGGGVRCTTFPLDRA